MRVLIRRGSRALAASIIGAVLLADCSRASRPPIHTEARVPVVAVAPGAVRPSTTMGGIIVPFQNVGIQNSLSEPTNAVEVVAGDHVSQGQVLARLDTRDLQAQLQQYLSMAASDGAKAQQAYLQAGLTISTNSNQVNSAQAALDTARATLDKDTRDLQRYSQLLSQGYVAQQQYDQQRTLVANDQQNVRSALVAVQNQVSQVKANGTVSSGLQGAIVASARADQQTALAQADQIRAMIAKATIVSPVDGVVVNRNLNPGEYPGTRQIFTIQQVDKVYAVLNGSGGQIIGLKPGSIARVTASDRATTTATGQVTAVLDEVTPGTTNFSVKVLLPNPQGFFHAGMVVAGIVTQPPTQGLRIPQTAFVDDTQTTVQIVVNGTIKTAPVTMVAEDGKNAIVRGLQRGAIVVSNGQLGLTDGQTINPVRTGRNVAER